MMWRISEPGDEVLFFIGISPTKIGGIELFARQLAIELGRRDFRVTFCFNTHPNDATAQLLDLPNARLMSMRNQDAFTLSIMRAIWRMLRSTHPATVVYSFGSIVRPLPWICRLSGTRNVIYNDHASRVPGDASLTGVKRIAARFFTYPVNSVIAVSEFVGQCSRQERLHGAKAISIPNGVDLSRREQSLSRQEFLYKYGIPEQRRVVSQLSWLVRVKGIDIFLNAAAEVLQHNADIHFIIGGDGPGRAEYERLAKKLCISGNVTFIGSLSDPLTSGLYTASDVFCLASRWSEACGLVLLEAMSFGVPVVATNIGGIPEFVRNNVDGLLCAPDASSFAYAILQLLRNEERRKEFGNSAKAQVEKKFDVRQMAAHYAEEIVTGTARNL